MIESLHELGLSDEAIALAQGMLLGDKSGLSSEVVSAFRTAGMSHIMAVSGLHVGIIMSIIWICFRPVEMLVGYLAPLNHHHVDHLDMFPSRRDARRVFGTSQPHRPLRAG